MLNSASCEKVLTCKGATKECYAIVFTEEMICDPRRRWMYCYEWKRKLGMVFDKDLGVYILPEWKEELMKRARRERKVKDLLRLANKKGAHTDN